MEEGRCKETLWDAKSWHQYQCSRKATKDGYCKQHHPDSVAERQRKSKAAYEEKRKKEPWFIASELQKKVEQKDAEIAAFKTTIARVNSLFNPCGHTGFESSVCDVCGYPQPFKYIATLKERVRELEAENYQYLNIIQANDLMRCIPTKENE